MFSIHLPLQRVKHEEPLRIHMDDHQGTSYLSACLASFINERDHNRPVVVLCIGTDRSTGDCLGPLVGSQLQENKSLNLPVYGTLDQPVHATNLHETLLEFESRHPNSFIIAIDACLGKLDSVGYISLSRGALRPGLGVHKDLPSVGEVHLTGIVNVGGFMEYLVLQNTRLSIVMKMANRITQIIIGAHNLCKTTGR